ncbi:hypothetical protein FRC11_009853, partial [Ceratobasidium sp. 423]
MASYRCSRESCKFRSPSDRAHAIHRSYHPSCELAHALEAARWKSILSDSLSNNIDFLDAVLPPSTGEPANINSDSNADDMWEDEDIIMTDLRFMSGLDEIGANDIAGDTQWGIPGPGPNTSQACGYSNFDMPSLPSNANAYHTSPSLPPPPILDYDTTWRRTACGEVYRTIAGAGHRIRGCIPSFNKLQEEQERQGKDPWDPFASLDEWELARWLVIHGLSKGAIDEFMKLNIVRSNLNLSFTSRHTLYNRINTLPGGPEWMNDIVTVYGNWRNRKGKRLREKLEVWFQDPTVIVKDLLGQPEFADIMVYEPRETYLDDTLQDRVYDEMWTGDWWIEIQKRLPYGATLVPLIFSSDKTCLTNFSGNKQAWPVYLTIGNIPKGTRRLVGSQATVLVGYLPVSKLKCCTAGDAHQQAEHWLFHTCMRKMLTTLEKAGLEGVEVECSDGWVRRCYPVLGAYITDHPEQCMIACCKQTTCPRCKVPSDKRQDNQLWEPKTQREVGAEVLTQSLGANSKTFEPNRYKPVGCAPFWYSLPHTDIFSSLTPDLLHQVHKGLFKDHIYSWCQILVDDDDLIDERYSALPPHPSLVSFNYGVTSLSQTTGRQHKSMEKSLVAVILGQVSPETVRAVQVAMDFIMLASLMTHTTSTLLWLRETLDTLHALKWVFLHPKVREDFNFPKFHALMHYIDAIRSHGSLDGYNSEISERLHIDLAKNAYRASNKREYMRQMAAWCYRLDAVFRRNKYIQWSLDTVSRSRPQLSSIMSHKISFKSTSGLTITLPKTPSFPSMAISKLEVRFKVTNFQAALHHFLQAACPHVIPLLTRHEQFDGFVKIDISIDPRMDPYAEHVDDSVRASPAPNASVTSPIIQETDDDEDGPSTSRFDTVLVRKHLENGLEFGMQNHLVARLRIIFRLPAHFNFDKPLAFVEWFTEPVLDEKSGLNRYLVK